MTHRLAICSSVVLGFLGAIYLYSAIDLLENGEFLPLPFVLGIFGTLVVYAAIRIIGWMAMPFLAKQRRPRKSDADARDRGRAAQSR